MLYITLVNILFKILIIRKRKLFKLNLEVKKIKLYNLNALSSKLHKRTYTFICYSLIHPKLCVRRSTFGHQCLQLCMIKILKWTIAYHHILLMYTSISCEWITVDDRSPPALKL